MTALPVTQQAQRKQPFCSQVCIFGSTQYGGVVAPALNRRGFSFTFLFTFYKFTIIQLYRQREYMDTHITKIHYTIITSYSD